MKNKLQSMFMGFIILMSANLVNSQVQVEAKVRSTISDDVNTLLKRYSKSALLEKISFDEEQLVFTGLPPDIEATKLHYLDIPYAVTTKEVTHIDEALTANGEYLKIITYLSKEDLGDKWPTEARYRVFLAEKVIALNSRLELIVETPNSTEYKSFHKQKGQDALTLGLFQGTEFPTLSRETIKEIEKAGFTVQVKETEYRFVKNDNTAMIYDFEHMYIGQLQKEGDVEVERINYFKRNDKGLIIPSHTRVHYPYKLPTGIKAMKRQLTVISNFTIEGKRYTGVDERSLTNTAAIKILPNPANDILYCQLLFPGLPENNMITYQVTDVNGRVLVTIQKTKGDNTAAINISKLPAGVYLLRVLAGNRSLQQKFVKKNN